MCRSVFIVEVEEFRLVIPNSEKARCNDCEIIIGKRRVPYSGGTGERI